jgi:transcriptional regulator with XRE-family HTH domain
MQVMHSLYGADRPDAAAVLSKAVARAGKILGLSHAELARVIGLSPATISRLHAGQYQLEPQSKAFELSALLVRVYRSLDTIMAGDGAAASSWLRAEHRTLGGRPCDLIVRVQGLLEVLAYLDASRAKV